jgi:hypothetical protein
MGKARPRLTQIDRINNIDISKRELYGINRRNSTGSPIGIASTGISSGGGSGGNTGTANNYLLTSGGSMIGPIAFLELLNLVVLANKIDISKTSGYYTSFASLQATSATISTIIGATNSGQILILRGGGGTYIINNADNIVLIDQITSATFKGNDAMMFIYDNGIAKWLQLTHPFNPAFINQSLIPDADNAYNLGGVSNRWKNLYISGNSIFNANASFSVNVGLTTDNNIIEVLSTGIGNNNQCGMTLGKANTANNGFQLIYNHNSTAASRYINLTATENAVGTDGIILAADGHVNFNIASITKLQVTSTTVTSSVPLTLLSGLLYRVDGISSNTFINPTYTYIRCSGNTTITLPTAVGNTGLMFQFFKTDSSATTITIATTSSQTINGHITVIFSPQFYNFSVISNGVGWDAILSGVALA